MPVKKEASLDDQWTELWAHWYTNRDQRDKINAALVEVKMALRSQGITARRPAGPRPSLDMEDLSSKQV